MVPGFPKIHWSAHFHAHPLNREKMITAAYAGGCRRFESALRGFGGCPFAKDELVGNISTESMLMFCDERQIEVGIDRAALREAVDISQLVFS